MNKSIFLLIGTLFALNVAHAAPDAGKRPDFSQQCAGKAVNTKISVKAGDRTMQGTCQLGFKPNTPNGLERGAMRDPVVQNACKGKTKGTATTIKLNGKSIAGKCDVMFRPEMNGMRP